MSDTTTSADGGESSEIQGPFAAVSNQVSPQPTTLVETTLAETLGLSMHNAVTSQQSSQMTTAASVTNACARLLQASKRPAPKAKEKKEEDAAPEEEPMTAEKRDTPPPKRKFNIKNFFKSKDKDGAEQAGDDAEQQTTETSDNTSGNEETVKS